MASGKFGSSTLAQGVLTLLYTVPLNTVATVNVRFSNKNAASAKIRLAIGSGSSPVDGDYLSYDQSIPANGIIEDTGIVCSAGEKVWGYSAANGVNIRVHGFEEIA